MSTRTRLAGAAGLLLAATFLGAPARAQDDLDFKKLIERGRYADLGTKLEAYLELNKADPKLRRYLELNLQYLRRGAEPKRAGSELILFRGAKNDQVYKMPPASGGEGLMLPNSIRYMRTSWDKRLPRISRYFEEATTLVGGDGRTKHELERIIEHHKGGGLGTGANSTKSVLISASTRPISHFGPPYYILKVAPERAIFNTKGLHGEYEVLLPFWVLPKEIVAKCETLEELRNHPAYQQSKLKELQVSSYGYGAGGSSNNWEIIEANIRAGRPPLEGVAGLNWYFAEGTAVGPDATSRDVERFIEKVARRGGTVERVAVGDPRLPAGSQARTYLDAEGRPKVLLREGAPVKQVALLDELTHVFQLERMVKARGAAATEEILWRARIGDPAARDVVNRWELRAKRLVRSMAAPGDPIRDVLSRSIAELERELDPYAGARRGDGTIDWKRAATRFGGGLAHFSMALFLKELAVVAKTGDSLRIEEFFDGLLTTDFYVHYGLFSLGAMAGDAAYSAFMERTVSRFIRPKFVQSVIRSNLSLAVGMALPEIVGGRFSGRTFAIDLAGLGLSSTAVKAGVAGIRWAVTLEKLPGGARLATRLGQARRLAKVGGFMYHAVETAVVLYFGERISSEIHEALAEREARAAVEEAARRLLADPKGPGARQAMDDLSEAFRAHRDLLTRPLMEAEALLWERLGAMGDEVKQSDDALRRYRELAAQDPERYGHLVDSAARLAARKEAEFTRDAGRALEAFQNAWSASLPAVYGPADGPAQPSFIREPADAWVLRGANLEDPSAPDSSRFAWLERLLNRRHADQVVERVAELPETRLAAYDHEAAFWDALAAAHADDVMAAAEYQARADAARETRARDRAILLGGEPPATRPEAAPDLDGTARGFLDALNELSDDDSSD